MKRKLLIIGIMVIFVTVITFYLLSYFKKSDNGIEVITSKALIGNIVANFSTTGDVESKEKYEYYPYSSNKVKKIYVNIGDIVAKGDKLIEFEVQDYTTQLEIAQKQYEIAKLQLDILKKTKEKLKNQTSLSNQIQYGNQISGLQSSQNAASIDDQIKLQEKQVEIAYLNVKSIKDNISKQPKYIYATGYGAVTQINAKENNFTSMQLPVVVTENLNKLQVVINANQYDAQSIKVGQKATIKFLDKAYKGIVSYINPSATKSITQSGVDTFVKINVDIIDKNILKPNYSVDVNIEIGKKENILKIPSEAIITDKYGNEMVYIVDENNTAHLKKIKTGLSSDIETEVIFGLNSQDIVILNPPATVQEGTKVKIKGREETK
ncbi:efflux RND transporter periplasmic adaptor subunit [Caldicellulosiruptoraceae bacterium PP1]